MFTFRWVKQIVISNIGKFSCQTVWQSWRNSTIVYDRHYQGLNYFAEISKWAVPSWTLYTLTSVCKFTLCSLYISYSTYKENLSNNQGLFEYAIISYIVKTLMFDSWVVPLGEIGWNQICNSPYSQSYNSYNVSSENLVVDQLIILKFIFSLFSSLTWLILYWYCKEKFCLGHSWELKV